MTLRRPRLWRFRIGRQKSLAGVIPILKVLALPAGETRAITKWRLYVFCARYF